MWENMRVSTGRCGMEGLQQMSGGEECHLLQLVRHGYPLLRPSISLHAPLLHVHLSLQLLQTSLHARWHLQTVRREDASGHANITSAGMSAGYDKWDNRKLKGWETKISFRTDCKYYICDARIPHLIRKHHIHLYKTVNTFILSRPQTCRQDKIKNIKHVGCYLEQHICDSSDGAVRNHVPENYT